MSPFRVNILVLAAGRSSRMGGPNKLLATFDGIPLIRRSVETALSCSAGRIVVVVGHQASEIRVALDGLDVAIVENACFADGLSTSLISGFGRAAEGAGGVLVMLADQPGLTSDHLDKLIAAFDPCGQGSIVLATGEGRRGNPVILAAHLSEAIAALTGDVGARDIVTAHRTLVREVEIGAAALLDVDTPAAMAAAGGILPSSVRRDAAVDRSDESRI